MSSHHVIRENQEAALFLVHAETIVKTVIESFFEWSPLIVVSEECFQLVNHWGVKIDAIVYHPGFVENFEAEIALQQPIDLIGLHHGESILEKGIHYLQSKKCHSANIFTDTDELWEKLPSSLKKMNLNIGRGHQKGFLVRKGSYEKWFPADTSLKIVPGKKQAFHFTLPNGSSFSENLASEFEIKLEMEGLFKVSSKKSFQVWEPF